MQQTTTTSTGIAQASHTPHTPDLVFAPSQRVQGQPVRVERHVTPNGRTLERYWIGDRRVDRAALLHLTCPEHACPRRAETWARWAGAAGNGASRPAPTTETPAWNLRRHTRRAPPGMAPPQPKLQTERPVIHDGQPAVARPAQRLRRLACPHGAHEDIEIATPAWDLFTPEGRFLATVDGQEREAPAD